jgi:putative transposase
MNKAFKFRIYPDADQRVLFAKTFGCCRFIFNKMLEDKIAHYERTKAMLWTTPAKYKPLFPWLREVDSLALCNEQLHLETAYKNFFGDKGSGFPRFKRKHDDCSSYTTNLVNGNISLEDGFLKLPKAGKVKVRQHRSIPQGYRLKSVTVSLTPAGKYYASLLHEYEAGIEPVIPTPEKVLGLDFSMGGFYVSSDGKRADHPRPYQKTQEKLAR